MSKDAFKEFLMKGSAEILDTTNPWEIARFKTEMGTHVVYTNSKGNKAYSDEYAKQAYQSYIDKKPWLAVKKLKRTDAGYKKVALLKRDGDECFFCGKPFYPDDPATLEHLLPLSAGGTHGLDNLVLAHFKCNEMAGNMSVIDKVKLRDKMRAGLCVS